MIRTSSFLSYALGAAADLEVRKLPVSRGVVDSTIQEGGWEETFEVTKLDWLWPRICGDQPQIHGVKIDVQGMELEVLCGMQDTLRAQRPS
jgi:FkbM family methyltransferase